jgi:hypothetical protein
MDDCGDTKEDGGDEGGGDCLLICGTEDGLKQKSADGGCSSKERASDMTDQGARLKA